MRKFMVVGAAVAAVATPAKADTATDWWELASKFNVAQQASSMPSPPEMQRASSRAALAVFEAVNAIDRRYESYLKFPLAEASASQDAAGATAAYKVLLQHYPQHKSHIEESYAMTMAQIADGPAKQSGAAIGTQSAAAVMAVGGVEVVLIAQAIARRCLRTAAVRDSFPARDKAHGASRAAHGSRSRPRDHRADGPHYARPVAQAISPGGKIFVEEMKCSVDDSGLVF